MKPETILLFRIAEKDVTLEETTGRLGKILFEKGYIRYVGMRAVVTEEGDRRIARARSMSQGMRNRRK